MKDLSFSFVIPVFNRPQEVKELLDSFLSLKGNFQYEIVIVEDGSTQSSEHIVEEFKTDLNISYYFKENTGPGNSRNYGMNRAKGNYFIILDSDILLPSNYLIEVTTFLNKTYYDCFGGPDASHTLFSNLQKAISFAMTSVITTGGIRGGKKQVNKFQPRSFNMGLSKRAFVDTHGFGNIHPGEDPDLSLRLLKLGYKTVLIPNAVVFHKRRISWSKFYTQVKKFGMVRPILNKWHPESRSLVYWFPTLFSIGLLTSILLLVFKVVTWPLYLYVVYFTVALIISFIANKNIIVAMQSILAILIQFFGYGYGFLKSSLLVGLLKREPNKVFPQLFFKE
ncbi:glycosyltransferase [Winogradskyella vincentii]|uniref:Glycosyltransferase n=1 Tax=Winogradskyella vincentii TaxID=2877122 RepID=A0ABS7XYR0_9FLAO|nr:glycosyltransferase [Winogradskyella vincentii]MCA0152776.1 glycosyltransferase [Winogradskyella vincentii]